MTAPLFKPQVVLDTEGVLLKVIAETVTVCVAVAVLSLLSVTVHVTVVVPEGKVVGALFVTVLTPQLSPVVGVPRTMPEPVQLVIFVGAVIVGLIISAVAPTVIVPEVTVQLLLPVAVIV